MSKWGKIWGGIKAGLEVGAMLDPHVALINTAVHSAEAAMPDSPGADKKATVEAVSDAALAKLPLSDEQREHVRSVRSNYIDLVVAAENAVAAEKQAREELAALIQSFKKAA